MSKHIKRHHKQNHHKEKRHKKNGGIEHEKLHSQKIVVSSNKIVISLDEEYQRGKEFGNHFINLNSIIMGKGPMMNDYYHEANVTVYHGGKLRGIGRIGNLAVSHGGTVIAPDNSIGSLNVKGDVNFEKGSTYLIGLNINKSDDFNSGRIHTYGYGFLDGTLRISEIINLNSRNFTAHYTLLTADKGVLGKFDRIVVDNMPFDEAEEENDNYHFASKNHVASKKDAFSKDYADSRNDSISKNDPDSKNNLASKNIAAPNHDKAFNNEASSGADFESDDDKYFNDIDSDDIDDIDSSDVDFNDTYFGDVEDSNKIAKNSTSNSAIRSKDFVVVADDVDSSVLRYNAVPPSDYFHEKIHTIKTVVDGKPYIIKLGLFYMHNVVYLNIVGAPSD